MTYWPISLAESVRIAIAQVRVQVGSQLIQVTVSSGAVQWRKDMAHVDQMLEGCIDPVCYPV